MSSDMRDYLDGSVPRTPEQRRAHEDTLAHAGMQTDAWKARNKTTAVEFEDARGFHTMPSGDTDPDVIVKAQQKGERYFVRLPE